MTLTPGTQLGPYEILGPLGAGGMGEVYRAKDTRLDREVAVKVLPERLARDVEALARFEREAKAVAALSHPNILTIYDVGADQGVSYAVTELLQGETLRDRLRRAAVPWRKAVEIGVGIADGLAAAHAKGVVHRDLKPENVFLTSDGVVKILDFGLARVEGAGGPQDVAASPTMTLETRPGTLLGTVNYMSPEQVRGQPADARSDIFSFGCVLYEMVTGGRAFSRETTAETMAAILRDEPRDIAAAGTDIPPELDRFLRHCLEKDPEQRFQSARDLAFDLRTVSSDSVVSRVYPGAAAARSRAPLWIAAACIVVAVLAVLIVAYRVGPWAGREPAPARPVVVGRISSLAVLPLANLSGDPEQEYFADGMTEALIADLAKISALRVISRTSAMHYKGTDKRLPQIARELNVDAVVEGSVLCAGDKVRITAQLINAATDEHLWADSYERDLRDVLALQGEVARTIARQIQVTLTPQEEARLGSTRALDPVAYQLYLKGRYHWNKRTEAGIRMAIDYFQQATEIDPSYAQAYAGLADCYSLLGDWHVVPAKEALPKAKAAAVAALEIDGSLAEARTSLASVKEFCDWDWAGAEREFQRAIELNPGYATAHHWYALFLVREGRMDEAVREIRRARELDPLSLIINTAVGFVFFAARDYDEAIDECRKVLEVDPHFQVAHFVLGAACVQKGMYSEAIEALRVANDLSEEQAESLRAALAAGGEKGLWQWWLRYLEDKSGRTYVPCYEIGEVYARLGETDKAFEWLGKAYEEREPGLLYLQVFPSYDGLRSDPRYRSLLRRIGVKARAFAPIPAAVPTGEKVMLAVLPFDDISPEPQEWFSDGMTEEMIAQLGCLQPAKLGVIGRTSAMRYKGTDKSLSQIGGELGVDYILEGSVRRAADRVRITAQLVQVRDQTHLWAESYERDVADVFAIQAEVAERIARSLAVELLPDQRASFAKSRTTSKEAHEAYLKGRYYWNKRTKEGMETSIGYFREAIDKDPAYALAYSGLADAYALMAFNHAVPPEQTVPQARAAARRALEIDDNLAEAHTSLAHIRFLYDWDFPAAEAGFRHALELKPGYATGRQWYAGYLSAMGRNDEALAEIERARQLDPLSLIINANKADFLFNARQYDRAIEQYRKTFEMEPDFPSHDDLGRAYELKGMPDEAFAEYERSARNSFGAGPQDIAAYRKAYTEGGMRGARRWYVEFLKRAVQWRFISPYEVAEEYALLGESDTAFEWLERAYDARDAWLVDLKSDPTWDTLRSDPRFDDLLLRIGFEPTPKPSATTPPTGKVMLAVLPFENLSPDPEQEYFSDGMTEEMIAQLGRLQPGQLGVIARTSAMRYKGTDKPVDRIGRELGVDYLLEGSVRRAGERVRITAQLIQVSDQTHLWAESYDRTLDDVFGIQADVAERVARSLAVELLPGGKAGVTRAPTTNAAAYQAYLKGRYFWNKRTIADLETAIKYFERAIECDPTYALAYSGLADTYDVLPYYRFARRDDEQAKAKAAAQRALELDDTLAEAHTSMAGVKFNDWDFEGAERCFRRAIELNPNYASARQWYGELLSTLGRHDEAIEQLRLARQLDPQSFVISFAEGACLYYARRYDEAIEELRATAEMEPDFAYVNWCLGLAYEHKGMHREAIAQYQTWLAYLGADEGVLADFASAYHAKGMEGALREWLAFLDSDARQKAVSPTVYARIYARLGELDDAFRWLEQAYEQRDPMLDRVNTDPRFDGLHGDPRFDDLLRRIGLSD